MEQQKISPSPKTPHNFFFLVCSILNSPCLSHEITAGPFGLLYDVVRWICINMSKELQPLYLANMFSKVFSENLTRNITALKETKM